VLFPEQLNYREVIMFDSKCKHPHMCDFSQGPMLSRTEPTIHKYCASCGTHWYNGKVFTKKEWDVYVEDFSNQKEDSK
jgi:ribosomal protein L37AE/L43A